MGSVLEKRGKVVSINPKNAGVKSRNIKLYAWNKEGEIVRVKTPL